MKPADEDKLQRAHARVTRAAERYAKISGLRLQPDAAQLRYVLNGLARNLVGYGWAYCPCRTVTGDPEKDRVNICPCRSHREEVERFGECECGLFVAPEALPLSTGPPGARNERTSEGPAEDQGGRGLSAEKPTS